jgi:hypothetical protein
MIAAPKFEGFALPPQVEVVELTGYPFPIPKFAPFDNVELLTPYLTPPFCDALPAFPANLNAAIC